MQNSGSSSITALIAKTELIPQTYCSAGWHLNRLSRMKQRNKKEAEWPRQYSWLQFAFWKVLARNREPACLTWNNLSSLAGSDKREMTMEVPERKRGCKNCMGKNTYWIWSYSELYVKALRVPTSSATWSLLFLKGFPVAFRVSPDVLQLCNCIMHALLCHGII